MDGIPEAAVTDWRLSHGRWWPRERRREAEAAVRTRLAWAGDDREREGVVDAPAPVVRADEAFAVGDEVDRVDGLERGAADTAEDGEMVVLRDVRLKSHCEHHVVPILGTAHVADLAARRVVGLGKLARVVETCAKRPQIQERPTAQIADTMRTVLQRRGIAVVVEAAHPCMTTRGIQKLGVTTVRGRMLGACRDDRATPREFRAMIGTSQGGSA
jgi:GTP cyclohydrolase I